MTLQEWVQKYDAKLLALKVENRILQAKIHPAVLLNPVWKEVPSEVQVTGRELRTYLEA